MKKMNARPSNLSSATAGPYGEIYAFAFELAWKYFLSTSISYLVISQKSPVIRYFLLVIFWGLLGQK